MCVCFSCRWHKAQASMEHRICTKNEADMLYLYPFGCLTFSELVRNVFSDCNGRFKCILTKCLLIGSFTPHEGVRLKTPWREGPLYKRTKPSRSPWCLDVLNHDGMFGIRGRRTNGAFTPKANKTFSLCYLREFDRRVHLCLLVFLVQARVCV